MLSAVFNFNLYSTRLHLHNKISIYSSMQLHPYAGTDRLIVKQNKVGIFYSVPQNISKLHSYQKKSK